MNINITSLRVVRKENLVGITQDLMPNRGGGGRPATCAVPSPPSGGCVSGPIITRVSEMGKTHRVVLMGNVPWRLLAADGIRRK